MSIILYDYWRSSAAYRVRIALNLANLPYKTVPVDLLTAQHKAPENLARNPQGLVPTLQMDNRLMTQSLAIIEYLDEAGYGRFLPKGLLERTHVRALSYAIAMEIHPVCNLSVARFACDKSNGNLDMATWMQEFIPKGLSAFEAMLHPNSKYCHGDLISMADICLIPQIYNANRWQVSLQPYPQIQEIVLRLESYDAIFKAHPDRVKPLTSS